MVTQVFATLGSAVLLAQMSTAIGTPSAFTVDTDASVFAVVTHKAGFASRFAHNHLIVAGDHRTRLRWS
jgi:hypothetical protein